MFLLSILISLLCFDAVLLILIILIQKSKGGMGLGSLGGGTQMLFGGSGGQDLFQKITWVLGAIFMAGSLFLSIMWSKTASKPYQLGTPSPVQSMPYKQQAPAQPAIPAPLEQTNAKK